MQRRTPNHIFVDAPGSYVLKMEGIAIDQQDLNFLEEPGTVWFEIFASFFKLGGWSTFCSMSLQGHQPARVKVVEEL